MNETRFEAFSDWMQRRLVDGPLAAEEVVRALCPLMSQVAQTHQHGLVAPLVGLRSLQIADHAIFFSAIDAIAPRLNAEAVARIERVDQRAVEVTDRSVLDTTGARPIQRSRDILNPGEIPEVPAFSPGYLTWEHVVEHHDPLTDIFSLGMILASLALGIDLSGEEELQQFVHARRNPFALNPQIHPVLARCLVRMTEPQRSRRAQDLAGLTALLLNHRDQTNQAWPLDLAGPETGPRSRRQRIQERLRDRLFDCSRRNRLLHYKPTLAHLNLTVASVPLQLQVDSIRTDDLCTWKGNFAARILSGSAVNLGTWLRVEDAPYLPGTLDRIRVEEKRDRAEYGASQLRLVIGFLRWHDLKENKQERITSPFILLPVSIEKKKGVRDSWTLTATSTEAEINPALRHHLRQIYGLELPEVVDLAETPIEAFHTRLQDAIQASEPGVTLRLVDRPRIDLVLQRARARTEHHRRRARLTGRGIKRIDDIDYSYDPDNFQPLGLQIYLRRVKPSQLALATPAGEGPQPRKAFMVAPTEDGIRTRETFVLREDGDANPYEWDLDICNVTLGNFNYRKMCLVRDYRTLLEKDAAHPAFDAVFAESARPVDAADAEHGLSNPTTLWSAVPSDPTQDAAVGRARSGLSYVIQGPPGTGKSQTITNLIADHVARGKRVLFVCAKRAALDVVHHRLAQRGLDRLCCVIHDSQEDKKSFIHGLRTSYEDWLASPDDVISHRQERDRILADLRAATEPLERYARAMLESTPQDGLSLRSIVGRLVALAEHKPNAGDDAGIGLPGYAVWQQFGAAIHALASSLRNSGKVPIFAQLGLRLVQPAFFRDERPTQTIIQALERCEKALSAWASCMQNSGGSEVFSEVTLPEAGAVTADAKQLQLLVERDLLRLIDRSDPAHEELRAAVRTRQQLADAVSVAAEKTTHWSDRLPAADCAAVLEQATVLQDGMFRFLKPGWWRLRRILKERYRFSAHVVPPRWSTIVSDLEAHYNALARLNAADRNLASTWKVDDLHTLVTILGEIHGATSLPPAVVRLRDLVRAGTITAPRLATIANAAETVAQSQLCCSELFSHWTSRTLPQLTSDLAELRRDIPALAQLLPSLRALVGAPEQLWQVLRDRPWTPDAIESAILYAAVSAAERNDPGLLHAEGDSLSGAAEQLRSHYRALLDANARLILAEAQNRFMDKARRSGNPGATDATEREWRKCYARGRRELEHEFNKVMRYRSIRDLSDDETGLVVADLKPIWLMSPLSVSDTLPLNQSGFDVVIFDEASQIPVEEAIPALYRAPQSIVVGDRQQLPPSDFFGAGGNSDEDSLTHSDESEATRIDLEHDSFLTQAAANLPGTMLGWHYRSRSESLIAFSNAAFYDGRLLTVPDVTLPHGGSDIIIDVPTVGAERVDQVLDRPILFHRMAASPYLGRRNEGEAVYIAHLLRGLLARKTGHSIGIVAFSEAQQGEIERAIQDVANQDSVFRERLEFETQREEDGQFCGLFIKNLENVQGDERDIIILSVCYGPDRSGRMVMNFGPINQSGGEKRLNVVFSRARRHMVLVSSITAAAITNDYNTGANTFKRYLAYAAACSAGETERAQHILATCTAAKNDPARSTVDPIAESIAAAIRAHGWLVDIAVGRSHFRCDLAIRGPDDVTYRLGILIDHEHDYRNLSVWERDLARPTTLKAFGWRIIRMRAKEWMQGKEQAIEVILAGLITESGQAEIASV